MPKKISLLILLLITACTQNSAELRLGAISDIHGHYENIKALAADFGDVDGIIIAGDLAQHSRDKPHNLTDYEEIYKSIEAAIKTGVPVYVIPGNHEMREDYEKAVSEFNVTDMAKTRTVDLGTIILVSNPYGTDFTYSTEGYRGTAEDIRDLESIIQGINKPILLISHQPPKCKGKNGIDVANSGDNAGDKTLDEIMRKNNIKFSISGHIHEAGGRACTAEGEAVEENAFSEELRFNPGAASPWKYLDGRTVKARAGIMTFKGAKAKYEALEI